MTPAQWRLARQIPAMVEAENALTEQQLVGMLDADHADVHAAVGMLIGRRKIDRAGDYLVPSQPGRAA
ncbi:MAG: hypothetical protein ACRDOK_01580 [Streptosporangiaceae bacterium]